MTPDDLNAMAKTLVKTMTEFKRQMYGAEVATILESDDEVLEVVRRQDGKFDLTVHNRQPDTDRWDDLTVTLGPKHFIELGNVVEATLCCRPDCPYFEKPSVRACKCHPRNAALLEQEGR